MIRIALDLSGISFQGTGYEGWNTPLWSASPAEDRRNESRRILVHSPLSFCQVPAILLLQRRYISPDADLKMATTIDIMVEGWNDVISGYSAHLFNDPCALYSWIRKRFLPFFL